MSAALPPSARFLLSALLSIALAQRAGAERRNWTGRALLRDGSPAAGARVVSSAGGEAVTSADGRFALDVDVPEGAESVEITALLAAGARGEGMIATARVVPAALTASTAVGTLVLQSPSTCTRRWLPTFGAEPGVVGGEVHAMTVFDDGSGPALYVGGRFTVAGGVAATSIAVWDGGRWRAIGDITGGPLTQPRVRALAVFDDGAGAALYVAGSFGVAGGVPANGIARWDGHGWSALGAGVPTEVFALAVHDDGVSSRLYAGAQGVWRWDGSSWTQPGGGVGGGVVRAFATHDDGSGSALYAGGDFTTVGGQPAARIARWDGATWSPVGAGVSGLISSLAVYDDGTGPALYAGRHFTLAPGPVGGVVRWDGAAWSSLPNGAVRAVYVLAVAELGAGPVLVAGGGYSPWPSIGTEPRLAAWDGAAWTEVGDRLLGYEASALALFDVGRGPELHAAGRLYEAGGRRLGGIARLDQGAWRGLEARRAGADGLVSSFEVFDDGRGAALYAGGSLDAPGGVASPGVARFDGRSWESLAGGVVGVVSDLEVFDDGTGPALHVGGWFSSAGGIAATHVARWDGASWSAVGAGVDGTTNPDVLSLAVYDDGHGPALYAAGRFTTAGGVNANCIARWDGTSWSALGSGTSEAVRALRVFDDGGGPALFVGGEFSSAGGLAANRFARWDGSSWSAPLGVFGGTIQTLAVFDDGNGPALYAGGAFTAAGDVAAMNLARWDGAGWSPLGAGLGGEVLALAAFDDGRGSALYAGGWFETSPARDAWMAKWGCAKGQRTTRR